MIWLIAIVVLVVFALLTSIWLLVILFYTRVPFVKTPEKKLSALIVELSLHKESLVYDLGCGDAHVLIEIEKATGAQTIGFELSPIAYMKALWNIKRSNSKTKVFFKDFTKANIRDADVVFVFLIVGVMEKTWDMLRKNLNPGTRVISYGFEFPEVVPDKIIKNQIKPRSSNFYFYTV